MHTSSAVQSREDDQFPLVAEAVRRSMELHLVGFAKPRPVFTTKVDNLFQIYLDGFAPRHRQTHNCHCCRVFIEKYGGLVVITEAGETLPVFWNHHEVPNEYKESIRSLSEVVSQAQVNGVFLSGEASWGLRKSGISKLDGHAWEHFAVPTPHRFQHPLLTAGQMMAQRVEEYGMLQRGLAEFNLDLVQKAKTIVAAYVLYRGEKVAGPVTWLHDLHVKRKAAKTRAQRENVTWLAVATAPPGFAHVKTTMIGTLLDDLKEGVSLDEAARRFKEKMHPLQYLRPQAAPSDGELAAAEKVVAKLQSAGSLNRRFARLDEVKKLWTPKVDREFAGQGGVFEHLKQSAKKRGDDARLTEAQHVTWAKFAEKVLPTAEKIECKAPAVGAYVAMVTAADREAPPILRWDRDTERNSVSWYVYHNGSSASQWGLTPHKWVEVMALVESPAFWNGKTPGEKNHVCAILKGAVDSRDDAGNALFPEILKSEYHSIRRAIEAYSQNAKLGGREQSDANGIMLASEGGNRGGGYVDIRVLSRGIWVQYVIDRWD